MLDIDLIARQADIIVGGFAVLPFADGYKVVNLNNARGVAVFSEDGLLIETDMDDIELSIARRTLAEAMSYEEA